jgi:Flp pilus assembly protein TadD
MAPADIEQSFHLALKHHQAGRLGKAEQSYREILARQPRHAGALHYSGVLAHQQGRSDAAVDLIRQAIALDPNAPEAHNNLGLALKENGQVNQAIASYRKALALKPNHASALYNLGVALQGQGEVDDAISALRGAIALKPNYPEAHNDLGIALRGQGRFPEAITAFNQAIALRPAYAQAYNNLGGALAAHGELDKAIVAYRHAIALNAGLVEAHNNLAIALSDQGKAEEANTAFRWALALQASLRRNGAESAAERSTRASASGVYLSHHPDSHTRFCAHKEFAELLAGFTANNMSNNAGDIPRLWSLMLNIKQIIDEGIGGDFAELGVWRGNSAAVLAHYAELSNRQLFLFDTFSGFSEEDLIGVDGMKKPEFADTSLDLVKSVVGDRACCHFVKGRFPDTITEEHRSRSFAAVNLDCDLYEPMSAALGFFYPRMTRGAVLFLHDYSSGFWAGAKKAIDEFCAKTGEFCILLPDKSGSAFVRKTR